MDQRLTWIIGLSIVVIVIAMWRYRNGNESRKRFEQREELDLDAIYFWYFAHRGLPRDQVIELWCEVAESLDLPAGKLRPSDRFDGELAAVTGWGFDNPSGILTYVALQREESYKDYTTNGFPAIQTLGDYIECFCDLELKNHGDNQGRGQKSG